MSLWRQKPTDKNTKPRLYKKPVPIILTYADILRENEIYSILNNKSDRLKSERVKENVVEEKDKEEILDGKDGKEEEEMEEMEHGQYDSDDKSDKTGLSRRSFLFRMDMDKHRQFLRQASWTRSSVLKNLGMIERSIYEFLILLKPVSLISAIWRFPQKSAQWHWARTCRLTGSVTGAIAGQQRGTPVCRAPFDTIWLKFKGGPATIWGSGKKLYGTQCYIDDFQRVVVGEFRRQRKLGS